MDAEVTLEGYFSEEDLAWLGNLENYWYKDQPALETLENMERRAADRGKTVAALLEELFAPAP